jgi:hypothetical protein
MIQLPAFVGNNAQLILKDHPLAIGTSDELLSLIWVTGSVVNSGQVEVYHARFRIPVRILEKEPGLCCRSAELM